MLPNFCDVSNFYTIFLLKVLERRMLKGSENVVKNTRIEILALGGTKMEGVLARVAAKRRPSRDLEVRRQIRSFTYQFR